MVSARKRGPCAQKANGLREECQDIREIISNVRTRPITSSTTNRPPTVTLAAGSPEAHGFEARQVFGLPRVKLEVTGHRAWFARCSCGRRHQAEFPEPLKAAVQYGPRLKAFAACLHHHHMVPAGRTADILESLCGVRPSGGTVLNFVEEAASRIEPAWERIGQALRHTPVLGADESGMRTAGKAWLHVLTNPLLSCSESTQNAGAKPSTSSGCCPTLTEPSSMTASSATRAAPADMH